MALFISEVGLLEKQPSLDLWRNLDAVLLDLPKLLVVLPPEGEESLTRLPAEVGEVAVEVVWQQHRPIVVLEGRVEELQDVVEGFVCRSPSDRSVRPASRRFRGESR